MNKKAIYYEALEALPFNDCYSLGFTEYYNRALINIACHALAYGGYVLVKRVFDERLNCWVGIKL